MNLPTNPFMLGDSVKMNSPVEGMISRLAYKDQVRHQSSGAEVAAAQAVLVPAERVSSTEGNSTGDEIGAVGNTKSNGGSKRRTVPILLGVGALVVIAAIGGSLAATKQAVARKSNASDSLSSSLPTPAPSRAISATTTPTIPRNSVIQSLLAGIYDPGDMPMPEDSPQKRAEEWLLSDQAGEETLASNSRMLTRYALALLYYATNGETWDFQVNFAVPNRHECDWNVDANTGTRCDSSGNVVSIKMPNNSLLGSIPTEIGLLTALNVLQLRGAQVNNGDVNVASNILTGTLPTEIGNLKELIQLDLSGTSRLSGTIPTEVASLDKLVELRLSDNDFTGAVPSVIGAMSSLTFADFDNNDLTELPVALRSIQCISVRGNNLTSCSLFDLRWRRSLQASASRLVEDCFIYVPPCELPSSV